MTDINAGVEVDTVFAKNEREARLRYSKHYQLWEPDPEGNQPLRLRFDGDTAIKTSLIDAFYAYSLTISPKLRDVLAQFDLGSTRLYEVPIYEEDGETLSSYPPYYVLHVTETKPTLILEESKHIDQPIEPGQTKPKPDAFWRPRLKPDELAAKASAAVGVDIWADPILKRRLFVSDRLKQAIDAAGIRSKALTFVQARTLP